MNVGFDLDKIFINFPPFVPTKIIDWLYKGKPNGTLKYRIPSRLEQIIRIFSHYPFFRPPITKNMNYVKNLALANKNKSSTFFSRSINSSIKSQHSEKVLDKYYLISSRFSFLEKKTTGLIKRYSLDKIFNAMYFNYENRQPHEFKNEMVKKLDLDMYVDDDLQLLEYLVDNNPKTKFFWLNNKVSKPLGKNLYAIKNISEMFTPLSGV